MATFTKKKCILVIFGKFKKRNPHVVGFFRQILDQNVVVGVKCSFNRITNVANTRNLKAHSRKEKNRF